MQLSDKINEAMQIIAQAVDEHPNKCFLAYSGGKDSRAIRRLAQEAHVRLLTIHNEHPGEDPGIVPGLLITRAPKTNFPEFLKLVHLTAQIDGTRKDEDKDVIFDGTNIHRSKMPTHKIPNGVFGLTVYCPLFNWTETDVLDYLNGHLR